MSVFLFSSCAEEADFAESGPVTVGIVAGNGESRTTMSQNGLSATWDAGDEIALWALNSSGSLVLNAQKFIAYGLDLDRGFFTSTLSSAMPQDTYTYYASYPMPKSVNGTKATFSIPDIQDGKVSSGADIMISNPVQHGPLTSLPEVEDHSSMAVKMNRMLHQFRFYIPENEQNNIGNNKIAKIELTFPESVAGDVVFDLSDPTSAGVYSLNKNKITLDLNKPMAVSSESKGEYDFACVALAPKSFKTGDAVQVRAFTDNKIAEVDPIDLCARTFEAGHSTPVRLLVKEFVDFPYSITFKLAGNDVGEEVTSVQLTAPSGCVWPQSGTNTYTYIPESGHMSVGETLTFRYPDYADYSRFSGKNISVVIETENTIYTTTANIGTIPSNAVTHTSNITVSVPYLLYQNFGSTSTYNDGHDNPTVGTSSDTYVGIKELSSAGLSGWYATRVGIEGGKSARICCRYEHVLLAGAYYKGRLYTPQLSRIKEGKDVKLQVSFKYGSNRNERKPLLSSKPDKAPVLYFGINTQDVPTNPDENEGDIIDKVTGLYSGSGYASSAATSLSPMVIKAEVLDKENGSYTNLPKTKTVTIDNVDKYMRLAWILSTNNSASNTNANYWFYIDEIKVQIIK